MFRERHNGNDNMSGYCADYEAQKGEMYGLQKCSKTDL